MSPEKILEDWRPGYAEKPPVDQKTALRLARLGDRDELCDADTAIAAATEIIEGSGLNATSRADVSGFMRQLANLLGEYHREVVDEVAYGANPVQRRVQYDLKLWFVEEALKTAAHRRFQHCRPARLALAFHAVDEVPGLRRTQEWQDACHDRDGDRALALVRNALEARRD